MNWEKECREEFQNWVEKGLWQGEDEYTKNFAVGNVADWWIEKFKSTLSQRDKELLEKIEGMKIESCSCNKTGEACNKCGGFHRKIGINSALDSVINLIKKQK